MATPAIAKNQIIGISWSDFQEESWKMDEAAAQAIAVIGYDHLIKEDRAFYITFDNKEVGRISALDYGRGS